jgi:predicted HicB family RNase H-like nuclease
MLQVRIPAKQKRLLEEAARQMGLSLSAWIRLVALKAERDQPTGGQ